jgi:glycerol-3-phosphate dehydrogenase
MNYEIHGVLGEGAFGKVMASFLYENGLIHCDPHGSIFINMPASDVERSRRVP